VIVSLVVLGLFINRNQWVLAVLPVILLAPSVNLKMNRHKNLFYWFYPAHLAVIALAKLWIHHDGWMKAAFGRLHYLSKSSDCSCWGLVVAST